MKEVVVVNEAEFNKAVCCELTCHSTAEWDIWWGNLPDENTLACSVHVGELLNPDAENRVYKFGSR